MKCYELKEDSLVPGLLIDDELGPPHVRVDGLNWIPLDRPSVAIYAEVPKLAPIRAKYMTFTKDNEKLIFSKKVDKTAFVLINVHGGVGGLVTCTACSFSNVEKDGMVVEKGYHMFPPPGVNVLGPVLEDEPNQWELGAPQLVLGMTMIPGASFRVHRTGHLRGLRKNMYVSWDGCELLVTPPLKQNVSLSEVVGGEQLSM